MRRRARAAFGKKDMPQRPALFAVAQTKEGRTFFRHRVREGKIRAETDQAHGFHRRALAGHLAPRQRQRRFRRFRFGGRCRQLRQGRTVLHIRRIKRQRRRQRIILELVNQADIQCLASTHASPLGDHRQGHFHADKTRQALGTARSRHDAEDHLRKAKLRLWGGDPPAAGKRQFQPAAKAGALDGRDDRDRRGFECSDDRRQVRLRHGQTEFTGVGAGRENVTGAGQDDPVHLAIASDGRQSGDKPGADVMVDGIDRRPVDLDDRGPSIPVMLY